MTTEVRIVETRWVRPVKEVIGIASRLLDSEFGPATSGPGEQGRRTPDAVSSGVVSVSDSSIRARLEDAARQDEKRRRLLEILGRPNPIWDPESHPDIDAAGGAAAWVKRLRDEAERGFRKRTGTRKP